MFTNQITIEGRLVDDPIVFDNLTEFVILTNRRKQNDTGEWVNADTSRFTIKTFRTLASKAGEHLTKGDAVIVVGSIITDQWTDTQTGGNRYKQVVLADAVARSL